MLNYLLFYQLCKRNECFLLLVECRLNVMCDTFFNYFFFWSKTVTMVANFKDIFFSKIKINNYGEK